MRHLYTFLLAVCLTFGTCFAQAGNALSFDGSNDQVVCGLPTLFNSLPANNFTFEAWVYPTGAIFSRIIFAQGSATNFATMSTGGTNNVYFYVVSGGTNYSIATTASLPTNQWTHVATRWTASTQSLAVFFNGVLQAGAAGGTSSTGTSGLMTLGTRPGGSQYFPGALDEVRVWSSARSQCEIQANMNRHFTGPQTTLVAYYDFDQGVASGNNAGLTTLNDGSGNANNGTLTNFTLTGATSNWIASGASITSSGNSSGGYSQTVNTMVCYNGSYTFPNGPTQINIIAPASYTSNLTAVNGCDSVIVTNVTPYAYNEVQDTGIICSGGSYTFPDGTTQAGITSQVSYTSLLVDMHGCDSSIITTVEVLPSYNYNDAATVCSGGSYQFPDGSIDTNITLQVIHTSMLSTTGGCDSIIVTTVDVSPTYFHLNSDSICSGDSYVFADGTVMTNITAQVTHTSPLQTVAGCDSIVVTTVNVEVADTSVTQAGMTLTATASGATYQWIDCNTGLPISGQTNASFTPTTNGSYAVVVTTPSNCSDTSSCHTVIVLGMASQAALQMQVYPNPTAGDFVLEVQGGIGESITVEIMNTLGQVVYITHVPAGKHAISLKDVAPGAYTLRVHTSTSDAATRLVVTH